LEIDAKNPELSAMWSYEPIDGTINIIKKLKMKAVLFKTPRQLEKDLKRLLLKEIQW
jgi:hypothetical protein